MVEDKEFNLVSTELKTIMQCTFFIKNTKCVPFFGLSYLNVKTLLSVCI